MANYWFDKPTKMKILSGYEGSSKLCLRQWLYHSRHDKIAWLKCVHLGRKNTLIKKYCKNMDFDIFCVCLCSRFLQRVITGSIKRAEKMFLFVRASEVFAGVLITSTSSRFSHVF